MRRRAIALRIEKLVLEGFGMGDGERIRASLERELTRLLAEPGVSQGWAQKADIDLLNGGEMAVGPGTKASAAGIQIARAIYGAIQK
ncbi:MAG: hypothetical protein JSW39_18680 [Desulfobacterales bacterium]|nr:MAG: hypothetical protein JSW39_18680 [Desulfobacterales bacterium]